MNNYICTNTKDIHTIIRVYNYMYLSLINEYLL